MSQINTVAYILIDDKKLLLVRPKNKNAFYMPGGKSDDGETTFNTLIRELKEELGIKLIKKSLVYYGVFKAQAYGKEKGVKVSIECYTGGHEGTPIAKSEIEEIRYFTSSEYLSMPETAPAVRLIIRNLNKKGLIE